MKREEEEKKLDKNQVNRKETECKKMQRKGGGLQENRCLPLFILRLSFDFFTSSFLPSIHVLPLLSSTYSM